MQKTNYHVDTLHIPGGANYADPEPGDFILTHGSNWQSYFIQFGQRLRFLKQFSYFNHCALIINKSGDLIEAIGSGVKMTNLSKYEPKEYVAIRLEELSDEDKGEMVFYVNSTLGKGYNWLSIFSLGLSLLSGLKFNFGIDDELICSGLLGSALEKSWDSFDKNTAYLMPADIARFYDIEGSGE